MNELDQSRQHRIDTQFLFSAAHLSAFLECAVDHFANAPDQPFNLIRASKMHNPVADNLERHSSTFLTHVKTPKELTEFAAAVIASISSRTPPPA
ncbi:hypothetical protein F5Y02DRAFT_76923 [Annulohypoxylon stygium]|nr:hypothetical protein F5Y02DRAFT_76923 [Annulohypoxylon stygium]